MLQHVNVIVHCFLVFLGNKMTTAPVTVPPWTATTARRSLVTAPVIVPEWIAMGTLLIPTATVTAPGIFATWKVVSQQIRV